MQKNPVSDSQRAATAARNVERAAQGERAMRAYTDKMAATDAKTGRLRLLRMARDAETASVEVVKVTRKKRSTAA